MFVRFHAQEVLHVRPGGRRKLVEYSKWKEAYCECNRSRVERGGNDVHLARIRWAVAFVRDVSKLRERVGKVRSVHGYEFRVREGEIFRTSA